MHEKYGRVILFRVLLGLSCFVAATMRFMRPRYDVASVFHAVLADPAARMRQMSLLAPNWNHHQE